MHYTYLYDGGLGDTLIRMFQSNSHARLNNLQPEDTCSIHIVSHNPFVHELFEWHPKRNQLKIFNHPWRPVVKNEDIKILNDIPEEKHPPDSDDEIMMWCSPEELELISNLDEPYVVISAISGSANRDITIENLKQIVPYVQSKGYKVIVVGRSYQRANPLNQGTENIFDFNDKIINLIDKLSVPATLMLLVGAKAVIAAHSSICLGNWLYARRPNLILIPHTYAQVQEEIGVKDPKDMALTAEDCFCFGFKFEETKVRFNSEFDVKVLEEIL